MAKLRTPVSQSEQKLVTVPAKLTAPRLANVVARKRLFNRLDTARECPLLWLCAPGGAGKTTLIASYCEARNLPAVWYQLDAGDRDIASFFYYMGLASRYAMSGTMSGTEAVASLPYLTAEYLLALPTFTANYFRELFSRLPRPSVVVFDNYQDAPSQGLLHEILAQGLDQLPPGVNAIIASRERPHEMFARARASGRMALIDWEETKLTEQESAAVLRLRHKEQGMHMNGDVVSQLHRRTQGWVAGLVLLTEGSVSHSLESHQLQVDATQAIFDYFAVEIFRRCDTVIQEFLLRTALLPKLSVEVVGQVTDRHMNECAVILRDLARRNFFTVQHGDGVYEYHPLFRAFLISRLGQQCSTSEINALKRVSAHGLAAGGEIETGISLLQEAEEWSAALELIFAHAPSLTRQGRTQTLQAWLDKTPPSLIAETPWALYWRGVCSVGSSPVFARENFERAYALFGKQKDSTPLYLTWSKIVESYGLEMDDITPLNRWLDLYPTLGVGRAPPKPEVEDTSVFAYLLGIRLHRPHHPDFLDYLARAERLLESSPETEGRLGRAIGLILCYWWLGDFKKMQRLLDRIGHQLNRQGNKPLTQLYGWICKLTYAGATGDSMAASRAAEEGLALAQASGVHLLDFQFYFHSTVERLSMGEIGQARALWQQMAALSAHQGRGHAALVSHAASFLYIHEGAVDNAVAEADRARRLAADNGFYLAEMAALLCYAVAAAQRGDTQAALDAIARSREMAERIQGKLFEYYCAFCEAHVRRLRDEMDLCIGSLRKALSLARTIGAVTPGWSRRDDTVALYRIALEVGIEPDYVRATIVKTSLCAPPDVDVNQWPWPIRIFTLGRFAVFKYDMALVFTGKSQKKPLELLRGLLALGGQNVEADKLACGLWPDADGDMARHALRTTLYRLRKLLGEKALLFQDGRLSLNAEYCWFDVSEFERRITRERTASLAEHAKQLCEHYRGAFLDDDSEPWSVTMRERLCSKFVRAIAQLGSSMESEGLATEAAELYERAIEIEPSTEEFYLRLMQVYRRLHRDGDAAAVYRRCCVELKNILSTTPSVRTTALFEKVQGAASLS